jgi:uncharacterized protein
MKQQEQSSGGGPEVRHNEAASRYELLLDGRVAGEAQYRMQGEDVVFTHTEVEPGHEGQGLGSRLAAFALDDVKSRGLKAVPQCRFIAGYIERHEKDYQDLVAR